jgi:F420-0:gamma-glutamyl ligase
MSENRIHRIALKRIGDSIQAEAEVTIAGEGTKTIPSALIRGFGAYADLAHLKVVEDAQLSDIRKRLYEAGFSKRAIATAVKSVVRVEERGD